MPHERTRCYIMAFFFVRFSRKKKKEGVLSLHWVDQRSFIFLQERRSLRFEVWTQGRRFYNGKRFERRKISLYYHPWVAGAERQRELSPSSLIDHLILITSGAQGLLSLLLSSILMDTGLAGWLIGWSNVPVSWCR